MQTGFPAERKRSGPRQLNIISYRGRCESYRDNNCRGAVNPPAPRHVPPPKGGQIATGAQIAAIKTPSQERMICEVWLTEKAVDGKITLAALADYGGG